MPGVQHAGLWVAAAAHQLLKAKLDDPRHQQEQAGVIARELEPGGPSRERARFDRLKPWRWGRAALQRRPALEPLRPSASRIAHTVCAETGMPEALSACAISVTERSCARSASTWSRIRGVLRGPFGPGLRSMKNIALPARSSVAIWCTLAGE